MVVNIRLKCAPLSNHLRFGSKIAKYTSPNRQMRVAGAENGTIFRYIRKELGAKRSSNLPERNLPKRYMYVLVRTMRGGAMEACKVGICNTREV